MKKAILLTLALAVTMPLGAQKIVNGSIKDVPRQGSYQPTFKSDGAKKKPAATWPASDTGSSRATGAAATSNSTSSP